jgi:hypothetical protein
MVGLLQALPGTKLYQRLSHQGRLLGDTTGDNVDGTTNFIPHEPRDAAPRLPEPPRIPVCAQALLSAHPHFPARIPGTPDLPFLEAGPRSWPLSGPTCASGSWVVNASNTGVCSSGRLCRRPSHFSLAVTLSIYGHHFRKICRVLRHDHTRMQSTTDANARIPGETTFLRQSSPMTTLGRRHDLDQRITQAQRDALCVRRAVLVMGLLAARPSRAWMYAAVFFPHHPWIRCASSRIRSSSSCVRLGLTALACALAFLALGAAYRKRLDERREECRRFAASVIESRLGPPPGQFDPREVAGDPPGDHTRMGRRFHWRNRP